MTYAVVVPTAGRPSLGALLAALAGGDGPRPERVVLVDDRPDPAAPALRVDGHGLPVAVVRGAGRGPAAARNAGWRACDAEWIAFLDDDVVPQSGWRAALAADLAQAAPDVGGSQGRIRVPLPQDRRPTDWERNVRGLEDARWATADLAYRRTALAAVGGFDERFPRAYREDADLGLRITAAGWRIVRGERWISHPVGPAPASISVRKQAGNADDVLMRALHGRGWRERAGVPRGRRPRHLAVTAAALAAVGGAVAMRRPGSSRTAAAVAGAGAAGWLAGTAELAWARIAPGPRTPREVATMLWTSAVLPPAATAWWVRGWLGLPGRLRRGDPQRVASQAASERQAPSAGATGVPAAVLFDRDGTLVVDVPYNGDPARVEPAPGARAALARLRAAGIPTAVVSNQSGIARGLLTEAQVRAVNARIEELLGPLGPWHYCPHAPEDACDCRKPAPGLVLRAARDLGVDPARCALVGDIGADVEAARAAGARPMLVPTAQTRPEEVADAPEVAADLEDAVERLLRSAA